MALLQREKEKENLGKITKVAVGDLKATENKMGDAWVLLELTAPIQWFPGSGRESLIQKIKRGALVRRGWHPSLQTVSRLSYAVDPVGGFLFACFIFLVSFT